MDQGNGLAFTSPTRLVANETDLSAYFMDDFSVGNDGVTLQGEARDTIEYSGLRLQVNGTAFTDRGVPYLNPTASRSWEISCLKFTFGPMGRGTARVSTAPKGGPTL
jgi:hypothetical protein